MSKIYRRKDGRWATQVSLGVDGKRKPKRKYIYGRNKADVKAKLLETIKEADKPKVPVVPEVTMENVSSRWLREKEGTVRPATLRDYSYHLQQHITPALGPRLVSQITPIDVENLFITMEDKGLSASCRRGTHSVLRNILNYAVKMRWASENVAYAVSPPPPAKSMNVLTQSQVKELLAVASGHPQGLAVTLAATLGMRLGEVLGLPWRNVDLERRIITVDQALQSINGEIMFVQPKTDSSNRQIRMPVFVHDLFVEHRKMQVEAFGMLPTLVTVTKSGNPVLPRNFSTAFKRMLSRAGLPPIRFHDLRHTAATLMLENKMDPLSISRTLGHADVRITLNTYTKLTPQMSDQVAKTVDLLYGTFDEFD